MNDKFNKTNLQKIKALAKRYPLGELYYKIKEKLAMPYQDYGQNYQSYLPGTEELMRQREEAFVYAPLISIVVPTYETEELFLKQMIDSVVEQTYANWELCIADGSRSDKVKQAVQRDYCGESRIKYQRLKQNGGISENTNQGFAMAKGEYIGLLDHDDLLVPSALCEMVREINRSGAEMLYSDEDKVSADLRQHMEPHFKLDFNRELLMGNNYICHFLLVSRRVLDQAGGLNGDYNGAQDFDFVLRCSEFAKGIAHIPKILYHWRMHSGSTAGNTDSKPYAYEAGRRAVEASLLRNHQTGVVTMSKDLGFYRTRYQAPKGATVGVLCWESGEKEGDSLRPIPPQWKEQIEKELAFCQARPVWDYQIQQKADYILLLHASAKPLQADSITELLGSCSREGIGLVGSKVIFRNKVRQCGYWYRDGAYKPRFQGLHRHFKGYYRRAFLPVEVDAVSLDLAVLDGGAMRDVMEKSGALAQEKGLLDWSALCTAIKASGYKIIADPAAEVMISE